MMKVAVLALGASGFSTPVERRQLTLRARGSQLRRRVATVEAEKTVPGLVRASADNPEEDDPEEDLAARETVRWAPPLALFDEDSASRWTTFAFQNEADEQNSTKAPAVMEVDANGWVVVAPVDAAPVAPVAADSSESEATAAPEASAEAEKEVSMAAELATFTLPLLLVWISSPLLSLVDTAAVRRRDSRSALAFEF